MHTPRKPGHTKPAKKAGAPSPVLLLSPPLFGAGRPDAFARAWVAPPDWEANLLHEIGPGVLQAGRFFALPAGTDPATVPEAFWAQNTWMNPCVIRFASIKEAATKLRAIQRNWWPHTEVLHRRTSLIQEALPHITRKEHAFPYAVPNQAMGSFILLDENTMIASAECSSPFPDGELLLAENHIDPPSTAYLKMWEALTRLGRLPQKGERCIDAGACPGGWTWVLDQCGAETLALDRSPLDPRLMASPRVRFRSGNAFALTPDKLADYGWDSVDWLCSDLICYPSKLYEWVKRWFDSGKVKNFVITLKMQGEADWESTRAFAALPGGRVYHACYNKHELTWVWPFNQS